MTSIFDMSLVIRFPSQWYYNYYIIITISVECSIYGIGYACHSDGSSVALLWCIQCYNLLFQKTTDSTSTVNSENNDDYIWLIYYGRSRIRQLVLNELLRSIGCGHDTTLFHE